MLSDYFNIKTKSENFKKRLGLLFETLQNKKILLYGAGQGFLELNKYYHFKDKLDIIGISDIKFSQNSHRNFEELKAYPPCEIPNLDFDVLLITNESYQRIIDSTSELLNNKQVIKTIFNEEVESEASIINYLEHCKFSKTFKKLKKKLQDKKVVLYGAGLFLQVIKEYYDLSDINIVGISDKRFKENKDSKCYNYKTYTLSELKELKIDYIIVSTKTYIGIMESLYYDIFKNTKIKIKSIYKKPFRDLLQDIWST